MMGPPCANIPHVYLGKRLRLLTRCTVAIKGTETKPLVKTPIPGPKAKAVVRKDDRFLVTTTKTAPVTIKRAKGIVVEDLDGNRLLDFASGIGVLNTGHSHPKVIKAIQDQAAQAVHFAGTDFYYPQQADLAEAISEIVPMTGTTKTFFCQSGTEANEASIKIVKHATGRGRLLAFQGAFHGRSQGSLSLTASKARQQEGFFPTMPGVTHLQFPNPFNNIWGINGYEDPKELTNRALEHVEQVFETYVPPQDVAALFWEPVQGEGGYIVPPMDYPKKLQRLLKNHGILLVADEVQTGFGRTGKWFASEHFGVKPDVMSIAKAMGSGMPIGASVARRALDFKGKGFHSNTYGGNLVAAAASHATIDVIRGEKLVENSAKMGEHMGKHLDDIMDDNPSVVDHRGLGLMRAIEFDNAALRDRVEDIAWKNGLILLGCGKKAIRFIPSLNVSRGQIDGAMEVLRQAIAKARN